MSASTPVLAPDRLVGLVLAAGLGRRMGGPKAEIVVGGLRLVDRATEALREAGCGSVVAVVPPGVEADAITVANPQAALGMRSSLAAGIEAVAQAADAVVVTLADMPGVTATAIAQVVAQWRPGRIAMAVSGGRRVHPIIMSPQMWREAVEMADADEGARRYLVLNEDRIDEAPVAINAADLDTPGDLAGWNGFSMTPSGPPTSGNARRIQGQEHLASGRLIDRFGRVATDLRVSLTDRCNLRCTYCMPEEGMSWLPSTSVLSDDEIVRLATIAMRDLGVREVRFTGGEPLVRAGLPDIVGRLREAARQLGLDVDLSITTNGVGLAGKADDLRAAGLDRVNVSLDTLHPETFKEITRRDRLDDVLEGLLAAQRAGFSPIKVNAVLIRGVNDDEAPDLLSWAIANGFQLRFIEQMPLDAQHEWNRSAMVTAEETLTRLRAVFDLTPVDKPRGSAPAELYRIRGTDAAVGVIASVSHPFCGACDRVRLTADGQIRNCLFARTESDLRTAMRAGADDAALARQWRRAMAVKAAGHGIDDLGFVQPARSMSAIGG